MQHTNHGPIIPPFPMPVSLVGALVDGKPNFLAIAFFSGATSRPPTMSVILEKKHYTNKGIRETGTFSVCIPSDSQAQVMDYCGLYSGNTVDKSDLFDVFFGDLETAPMIRECPVNVECRLTEVVNIGSNNIFLGEIVGTYVREDVMTDGTPDLEKIRPILLAQKTRRYHSLGGSMAKAWDIGKSYEPKKMDEKKEQ
jgi:flavin reductase (DIM6/NTAB) family NADH-FMN oxidoreductase RutF